MNDNYNKLLKDYKQLNVEFTQEKLNSIKENKKYMKLYSDYEEKENELKEEKEKYEELNNKNITNINNIKLLEEKNNKLEEDKWNNRIENTRNIRNNNINTEKKKKKKEESEEEENYENDFEIDKATLKNILEGEKTQDNNVNLDDYKEIHESQQLQSQLNFFESNNNIENINIKKSKHQKISPKNDINFKNSLMISNSISDSYGDNIINDLNKFRRLALEESSISNYYKK